METTAKQYELAINSAAEISQVLLDMEGGKYILAVFNELVQELLAGGNISGAVLVVRKLHETTRVTMEFGARAENDTPAWVASFTEALDDAFEASVF